MAALTEDQIARISDLLDQAEALVAQGAKGAAVRVFAGARELLVEFPKPGVVDGLVKKNELGFFNERERHRKKLIGPNQTGRPVLIMSDSLGLPRPVPAGTPPLEDKVYPRILAAAMPKHPVTSICQRYFTTEHARTELETHPELGREADVVLHVGLNDCANRMFLESERLAMQLLPDALSKRIVTFSQRNRRAIITQLPSKHYVPLDRFSENLDAILSMLQQRGARKIVVATIILPPTKSWAGTPGINLNFARYNLAIMEAVSRHGARLLDIDRHIWQAQHQDALLEDGMHLASEGHRIFAHEALQLLRFK